MVLHKAQAYEGHRDVSKVSFDIRTVENGPLAKKTV